MLTQQYDNLSDTYGQALEQVCSALESIDKLFASGVDLDQAPAGPYKAAVESLQTGLGLEGIVSTTRTAINTVVAIIRRMIDAVIDFLRSEQHSAQKCMKECAALIDYCNEIPPGAQPTRDVTNMSTLMMISYEGNFTRVFNKELLSFYQKAMSFRKHVPTKEIADVVESVRRGHTGEIELARFHAKLKEGLEDLGKIVDQKTAAIYHNCDPGKKVYTTDRMFGDRFIFGQIGEIKDGTFEYNCILKRDNGTRMRVNSFKAAKVDDIRLGARTIRAFCEDFLHNLSAEHELYKINREVTALTRMNSDRLGIKSLRAITNAIQNVYVVFTRHAMATTRNFINYLHDSSRAYAKNESA